MFCTVRCAVEDICSVTLGLHCSVSYPDSNMEVLVNDPKMVEVGTKNYSAFVGRRYEQHAEVEWKAYMLSNILHT